jgi:hypothetical protein
MIRIGVGFPSLGRARSQAFRLCWILLAAAIGCGGDTGAARIRVYPVKGQVLLPDGKPLTVGGVEFVGTKGAMMSVSGTLTPDGTFTLGTPDSRVGAPAGEYRVRLIADTSQFVASGKTTALDRNKLPYSPKYLDENTSGLTAVIEAGDNQLAPFRLTKATPQEAAAGRSGGSNRRSLD